MRPIDVRTGRLRAVAERQDRIARRLPELSARLASSGHQATDEQARAQAWHDQAARRTAELRQQAAELRQQLASLATSIARTEERVASTFEKVACNRPPQQAARLLAVAGDARNHALQERALAADYNRSQATARPGTNLQSGARHADQPAAAGTAP